jgi:hypothetical protein
METGSVRLEELTPEASGRPSLFYARDQTTVPSPRRKETKSLDDRADGELERLITKRQDPRDGDALLEPTYAESVRRYNARREEEHRSEWGNFHAKMSRLHRWLATEHDRKAAQLVED